MKKYLAAICLLLLCLTACGKTGDAPGIEGISWTLTSVQSVKDDGKVVACSPEEALLHEGAAEIKIDASAADGVLTLTDNTNGKTYRWKYQLRQDDRQSSIYEITSENAEAMASVSMTRYHDESQTPTLIIRFEDYALNFHGK